jgi:hypothetical protein
LRFTALREVDVFLVVIPAEAGIQDDLKKDDEAIGTRSVKMPILWNAPAGRRFFEACGVIRKRAGATCRAF